MEGSPGRGNGKMAANVINNKFVIHGNYVNDESAVELKKYT